MTLSTRTFLFIVMAWSLALMTCIGLKGCASVGYGDAKIDTVRKTILVANAELRSANLLLQDLIARDALTQSQAQQVKDSLQDAHDKLQAALNIVEISGDPTQAESTVARVNTILNAALLIMGQILEGETNGPNDGRTDRNGFERDASRLALAGIAWRAEGPGAFSVAASGGRKPRFADG